MRYIVTKHRGTIEWLKERGVEGIVVSHFDPEVIKPGDEVFGVIPIWQANIVCQRGGRYFHVCFALKPKQRGRELSKRDLEKLGAQIVEFRIEKKGELHAELSR